MWKKIITISKLALHIFYYRNQNPPMYVLQTRYEHLGSFHCLIFCLKLIRKLLFFYISFPEVAVATIVVLCMLYAKSAIKGLWQLTFEIPRISYGIWDFSKPKHLIIWGGIPFRNLKISAADYFYKNYSNNWIFQNMNIY